MSLIFYYSPMSTATLTELCLEELAVPHDKKKLDLKAGDTKKPEFLKLNPFGQVPVLVDGEGKITTYPALYLWNQPQGEANHTPAWDLFQLILG